MNVGGIKRKDNLTICTNGSQTRVYNELQNRKEEKENEWIINITSLLGKRKSSVTIFSFFLVK